MDSVKAFSVKISTIIHATEDPKKVERAIRNLCLAELSKGFTINRAKGHHGNEIATSVFTIRDAKSVQSFLSNMWNGFSQLDKTEVYSSLASRVDRSGTLFLRIDKQEALKRGVRLQNTDPIKIEISFRTKHSRHNEFVEDIHRALEEIQSPGSS